MPYRFGMNPNIFPGTGDLADCPPENDECQHDDIDWDGADGDFRRVCVDCGEELDDPDEGEDVFERAMAAKYPDRPPRTYAEMRKPG